MNTIARLSFAALLGLGLATEIRAQEWSATVDGVTAYFGVVRSEFARDMLSVHGATDRDGHGRPKPRSDDHHVLIAIFDAASGQRIPHALISASHDSGSGVDQRRALEAMTFGDAVTFGNFFRLEPDRKHDFAIEVLLPAHQTPARFHFTYGPEKTGAP